MQNSKGVANDKGVDWCGGMERERREYEKSKRLKN